MLAAQLEVVENFLTERLQIRRAFIRKQELAFDLLSRQAHQIQARLARRNMTAFCQCLRTVRVLNCTASAISASVNPAK